MNLSYFSFWISVLICLVYLYIKWLYGYWRRNRIPFAEPKIPFGNIHVINRREHLSQRLATMYQQFKNKSVENSSLLGLFFLFRPVLIVLDLDLVRRIFITDFQYFQDRGVFYNEKHDPLSAHLFNVEYEKWKPLRAKLTSTFTSGKMKLMFPTIVSVSNSFVDCLNNVIKTDSEVEIYEWLGRFTTDIIGTCAFGIECNSLNDPQAKFRQMGKKVFEQPKLNAMQRLLTMQFPSLARAIGICADHPDVTKFFLNIVKETITFRETNNVQRNDFMHLLIGLKNSKDKMEQLTINEIAAQAFVFFLAGFETSSTTLTYCLYELALDKNKHIQDEARREIKTMLEKYDGDLNYEALNEMTYIDQILNETLRKHPPAANLPRIATKNYKVPNSQYTIPKGMFVLIPVYGIHHDPEYFENPEEFEPKRFEPEQIQTRPSCAFMPFGDGPRNCIGLRFGMLQARIGLVKLLMNFEFSTCARTPVPIKYNIKKLILSPDDGMWLKVSARKM